MRTRNAYLRVRLTAEESQQLTRLAQQLYKKRTDFVRASAGRQGQLTVELHNLEKRQAAAMTAVHTEIARLQRTEFMLFAMLENLSNTILTYLPPPPAERKGSAVALGEPPMSDI